MGAAKGFERRWKRFFDFDLHAQILAGFGYFSIKDLHQQAHLPRVRLLRMRLLTPSNAKTWGGPKCCQKRPLSLPYSGVLNLDVRPGI
jgi:hypothetical protein